MSDASLIIRCDCDSPEHMFVLDAWHWDNEKPAHSMMNLSFQLSDGGFWQRLKYAVPYLLGCKGKGSAWADTVIAHADIVRMRDYLNTYLASAL